VPSSEGFLSSPAELASEPSSSESERSFFLDFLFEDLFLLLSGPLLFTEDLLRVVISECQEVWRGYEEKFGRVAHGHSVT